MSHTINDTAGYQCPPVSNGNVAGYLMLKAYAKQDRRFCNDTYRPDLTPHNRRDVPAFDNQSKSNKLDKPSSLIF